MTPTPGHLQERVWQFKLADGATDNCAAYFEKRAGALAAALNCRLVAMSGVKIEQQAGHAMMVVGTALLENPRENVVLFRRVGHK